MIWNEDRAGYRQVLQDQIMGLIAAGIESHATDRPGGIFVRPGDQVSDEDRILMQSVALVVIDDAKGTLIEQTSRLALPEPTIQKLIPRWNPRYPDRLSPTPSSYDHDLILSNELGGFTSDGREYVICLQPGQKTPAPWANVLANADFGTVVSETGQAYTWSENAHEFRLTPWNNDAVIDLGGEHFYLRDEISGEFWSPTLASDADTTPRITRHGFGYSVFEHSELGLHSELCIFVARTASIKFSVWKVRNDSDRTRTLSVTAYVEWVLGDLRPECAMHIVSEINPNTATLCASNPYHPEFSGNIGFLDVGSGNEKHTVTADRREFIGRNRTLHHPAAMDNTKLSGKVGAGLDPCAAVQVAFELRPGEEREIVFKLGIAPSRVAANELIRQYRGPSAVHKELLYVSQQWRDILGAVQIKTPDPALNVLANGWLMYQVIACRLWARSGHYQSGGAYGFRDQLQDVMAVVHTQPQLTREHLLRSAARQFIEGDVQHWWHPPLGRGVRTRCSDDYLWLPHAVSRYIATTKDTGVLDEPVRFLEGRALEPDESSYYDLPTHSEISASLYDHCVCAIELGLRFGEQGLPLMGSGDWNDGMDKVGIKGKGESVWLAFFLYDILIKFAPIAHSHGDLPFALRCTTQAEFLRQNIENHAWDGGWYRRAYFDDGQPLGSAQSPECQIDSISQSWAVLSGAGGIKRSRTAMHAVDEHLVKREHKLIELLEPPFDTSELDPGYIRGYVPGIRENGGQYSHAAVWTVMAFAKLGDRSRTWELLQMINPITHSVHAQHIYKVEPYVMAADIYAIHPHVGRGGWTWYTGSAGWMYQLILESFLGLRLEGSHLSFTPCLPPDWSSYTVDYHYRNTNYHIVVKESDMGATTTRIKINGIEQEGEVIQLIENGGAIQVDVEAINSVNNGAV